MSRALLTLSVDCCLNVMPEEETNGDLNLRVGEERDLQREGWRDAWSSLPGVDDWTWCRGSSTARYDRVFLHDAGDGDSAECAQIRRLTGVWPALSDHVALHAVVRRRSRVQVVPDEASSPATRQAALASSSSASGPAAAAPSSATSQAARTQRQSASAHASQAPAVHMLVCCFGLCPFHLFLILYRTNTRNT